MRQKTAIAAVVLVAAFIAGPGATFASGRVEKVSGQDLSSGGGSPAPSPNPQGLADAVKNLEAIQYSFREVARKVLPVVVEIDVTEVVKQQTPQLQSPFDWFFNQPPGGGRGGERQFRRSGLGSGIVVKKTGGTFYVLTNNHVVDSATNISVKLFDQRVFTGKVVGTDPRKDLAVVSFDSRDAIPLADLGDSNDLQVGDIVLAVGNPLGFENTLTMGIVSALGRRGPSGQVAPNTDYIQTDAAINQGNSGGALVNVKGQVVGINTWIAAPTGGNVGLGFAIPVNNAKRAIDDFISKGKVEYGWLGVQPDDVQAVDPANDAYPGVARDLAIAGMKGSMVINVYRNSPAEKAGMLPGDYITRVNGKDVPDRDHLIQAVGDLLAGRAYDFDIVRYGEKTRLSVKLGVRPDDTSDATSYKYLWPGVTVVRITDQIRQDASIAKGFDGVVVAYLPGGDSPDNESPASIAGLRPGDVVTQINGRDVRTIMDFYKALNDSPKKEVTFKINRKGTDVTIGLGK
ncbi:MAG TPA: Do family serine endopeptidase [Spirochaetia bacterium]|nr:Do family serine endopeptidase [Spirochaetia bacterium]